VKRVRADTFGYLQRSFSGVQSKIDVAEAAMCGCYAVVSAMGAEAGDPAGYPIMGTIGLQRKPGKKYAPDYVALPIQDAAKYTRSVPKEFIAKNGHDVTDAFRAYAAPLVGDLPWCEVL